MGCKNFGVADSDSYIQKSERLGYLSTECKLCGSNSPWINNELVKGVLAEKIAQQFAKKMVGCKKCSPYFLICETVESKRHGFTSAGTQRKKCCQCSHVFTLPNVKNSDALKKVLASLLIPQEINIAIKQSGLPARLYYFYLNKLATIFSTFSRMNESRLLTRKYLGMHSEGRLLKLNHQRGIYSIFSAEIDSGYILLQTHNLTKHPIADEFLYDEKENTLATNIESYNLEMILIERYQKNLKRNHFEQLIVGDLKPIAKCNAIYPDKVAYVHFQLLTAFTNKLGKCDHFIEHESTLRAASLMSSCDSIKSARTNVYFFLPFTGEGENLDGKRLGWWNDIWFSNKIGAFCPLTSKVKSPPTFPLNKGNRVENFYQYLNSRINKNMNSMQVIDDVSEIHRVIYNFCIDVEGKTAACLLGLSDHSYQTEQLFDLALKLISTE